MCAGVTTVQKNLQKIIAHKGKHQVGRITSGEHYEVIFLRKNVTLNLKMENLLPVLLQFRILGTITIF